MTKHIGIVAVSYEGAALCYQSICAEAASVMGEHNHPEVTMHSFPLADYMRFASKLDWEGVAGLLLDSVGKVASAGADFAICPANTAHEAFEFMRPRSPIPWLHIVEVVADVAVPPGLVQTWHSRDQVSDGRKSLRKGFIRSWHCGSDPGD